MILKPHVPYRAGFTLTETIVTTAIALLGIGAALALNTAHLRLVQSSRQSNAATTSLQERVEQMRLADWRRITDPTYLGSVLLAQRPKSSDPLNGLTERVTVSAYPDADSAGKLIVQRNANGGTVTLSEGAGLALQRLAQVELRIGWNGSDGRERVRATTTVISNGGISRMNLPGIGAPGGAPPSASTLESEAAATDSTASSNPTPTPTPAPLASNGRGNVGGKPGKK